MHFTWSTHLQKQRCSYLLQAMPATHQAQITCLPCLLQKAQEAKEDEDRKAQLLKDKEELEAGGPFPRARTEEERKLQAARRKEHEVARAQLFAGLEDGALAANGFGNHEGEGGKGEELPRVEDSPNKARGAWDSPSRARGVEDSRSKARELRDSPSRSRGVGSPGRFRDGGPRENGGLRQENGTGRFRFENGDTEKVHLKVSGLRPLKLLSVDRDWKLLFCRRVRVEVEAFLGGF